MGTAGGQASGQIGAVLPGVAPAGLGCAERAPAIYRLKIKLSVAETTGSRLHHSGSSSGEICDIHINTLCILQHTPYPTAFKRYTISF